MPDSTKIQGQFDQNEESMKSGCKERVRARNIGQALVVAGQMCFGSSIKRGDVQKGIKRFYDIAARNG